MSYVRAVYDFQTTEDGELSLRYGDVVLFLYDVDENWACGKIYGQVGTFPKAFIEFINVPATQQDQKLFAALKDFVGEMSGDLSFQRGDVIVGVKPIDNNWYHGQREDQFGIFPITHVRELDIAPEESMQSPPTPGSTADQHSSVTQSATGQHSAVIQPATGQHPTSTQDNTTESNYIAKGVASMNISAQIDEELGFYKGDVVNIIKALDTDFAIGECNGKTGMFPLAFVEIFEGQLNVADLQSPVEKRKSKFRWWEEESTGNDSNVSEENQYNMNTKTTEYNAPNDYSVNYNTPNSYSQSSTPPNVHHDVNYVSSNQHIEPYHTTQHDQSHDSYGYNVSNTISHESVVKTHRRTGSYTQENTRSHDSSIVPYARTLFPFVAESTNELTFTDNEIVTLIQHIDDQWVEGEIDGKCGIFPTGYVEIIVDCPWSESAPRIPEGNTECESRVAMGENREDSQNQSFDTSTVNAHDTNVEQSELPLKPADNSEQIESKVTEHGYNEQAAITTETAESENLNFASSCYGLVLYDYKSENEQEVSFLEGDTVSILQQVDADWFAVESEQGQRGFCPINYVDVLSVCPIPQSPLPREGDTSNVSNIESENQNESRIETDVYTHSVSLAETEEMNLDITPNIESQKDVPPKPVIMKPKPALKPKPSLKRKPNVQRTENRDETCDTAVQTPTDNAAQNIPNLDSITTARNDIPVLENKSCDVKGGEQVSPPQTKNSPSNAKIPPKRPTTVPKISVFAANSSIKTSDNLDEIIANQMLVAKQEVRTRAGSDSTENRNAPPIPERKNLPINNHFNRSLSADSKNKPQIPTNKKRVAFSTFYTSDDFVNPEQVSNSPQPVLRPRKGPQRPTNPPGFVQVEALTSSHVTPVPNRPAPPRPGAVKTGSNLMEFSPDKERSETGLDTECAEIIADLDKRIMEVEADLNKYVIEKEQLEAQLAEHTENIPEDGADTVGTDTNGDKAELQEKIGFTQANITGLTEELNSLKDSLYQFRPERMQADLELQRKAQLQKHQIEEERRKLEDARRQRDEVITKHRETRMRIIQEILQTEKDYLHSITLCHDVFTSDDPQRPAIDMELLFGNMDRVVALSQRLLASLEQATQGKDFEQQIIGQCFVSLKSDTTKVYAPYCRNHDDVITLLEKYEESSEIQEYFNKQVDLMRESATVFDLGSVLIKPVQRILKYPLLLNELIKNTEEDHVDKPELILAMSVMTQVAAAINEYKRRKDLVRKYKAVKEEGLGEKMSRFTMHSTKKKLSRLSQKMVGPLTVDENFNREERNYKNLESAIRLLARELNSYMEQVQEVAYSLETVANDLYDYYDDQSQPKIQQYCQCTNQIATKQFYKFKQQVELQVLHPLNRLLILYQAPNKVIKKRHDKLLDYDNLIGKGMTGSETQMAKNNYEALNAQLLDELPKLYKLSIEMIHECVGRLIRAQKGFYVACIEAMYTLPDEFLMSLDHENMDSFNISHQRAVEKWSQLMFIPKTFNPNIDERRMSVRERRSSEYQEPEWSSSQTSAMRAQLRTNYGNSKVHIVTSDYVGKGMMELSLSKGTLVGVIKERDPMGKMDRWFVDNGVSKGIFPTMHLSPAPSSATSSPSRPESSISSADNLLGLESPPKPHANPAVQAFDHPTLFDAVCSPTFGEILQPQPVNNQSNPLIPPDCQTNQSCPVIQTQSPNNQCTALLQPIPVFNQSDNATQSSPAQSSALSQSDSSAQNDSALSDSMVESEEMSYLYNEELYQALYTFAARTEIEISLEEGQVCKVINTRDLEGNSEWWLIEVDGVQGYAPANYLRAL